MHLLAAWQKRRESVFSLLNSCVPIVSSQDSFRKLAKCLTILANDIVHIRLQEESKSLSRNLASLRDPRCIPADEMRSRSKSSSCQNLKRLASLKSEAVLWNGNFDGIALRICIVSSRVYIQPGCRIGRRYDLGLNRGVFAREIQSRT